MTQAPTSRLLRPHTRSFGFAARAADLYFIAEHSPVEEMVNVVAASGSGVAFVRHAEVQAASLLDDVDDDGEDPEHAQQHEGGICQVGLTWSLNGLLCYWPANTKRARVLQTTFDAQDAAAGVELEVKQERQEALHQEIAKVLSWLTRREGRQWPRNGPALWTAF